MKKLQQLRPIRSRAAAAPDRPRDADEQTLAGIEADIEARLDEAVEFAMQSALPDLIELKRDVYARELT